MLLKDAFEEKQLGNELRFVENGEELLDYLRREGKFADTAESPCPGLDPAGSQHAAEWMGARR